MRKVLRAVDALFVQALKAGPQSGVAEACMEAFECVEDAVYAAILKRLIEDGIAVMLV